MPGRQHVPAEALHSLSSGSSLGEQHSHIPASPHPSIPAFPSRSAASAALTPPDTAFLAVVRGCPHVAVTLQRFCHEHLPGFSGTHRGQPPGRAGSDPRPAGKENTRVYTCEHGCFFLNKINCITRVEKTLYSYFIPVSHLGIICTSASSDVPGQHGPVCPQPKVLAAEKPRSRQRQEPPGWWGGGKGTPGSHP